MKKRFIAIIAMALIAIVAFTVAASAAGFGRGMRNLNVNTQQSTTVSDTSYCACGNGNCIGLGGICRDLMWDADGAIVSRDVFENNLSQAITDGIISADDKDYYIERYDYCLDNDGAFRTGCGGGRGMGGCRR